MVPSGVRRAGVRASGAPGAKLLAGAERNHRDGEGHCDVLSPDLGLPFTGIKLIHFLLLMCEL